VNQLLKSVMREIRTLRSVGAGGGRLLSATRWPVRSRPLPDWASLVEVTTVYYFRCAQ
jgi:hypothetical protein